MNQVSRGREVLSRKQEVFSLWSRLSATEMTLSVFAPTAMHLVVLGKKSFKSHRMLR